MHLLSFLLDRRNLSQRDFSILQEGLARETKMAASLSHASGQLTGLPDVLRRFDRGWKHFVGIYRPLADEWAVYDNSGRSPKLLEQWP